MSITNNTEESNWWADFVPEVSDMLTFGINYASFQEFLKMPSMEVLWRGDVIVYRVLSEKPGYIEAIRLTPTLNPWRATQVSGFFRVGPWPIHTEFIEFVNNIENFEEILLEHGINAGVINVAVFTHPSDGQGIQGDPPPGSTPRICIWIQTDVGDFFLEHRPSPRADPLSEAFTFHFHDLDGHRRRFGD